MGTEIKFPETPLYYIGKKTNRHKIPSVYGYTQSNQVTAIRYNSVLTYESFTEWQEYLAVYNIIVKLDENGDWYLIE